MQNSKDVISHVKMNDSLKFPEKWQGRGRGQIQMVGVQIYLSVRVSESRHEETERYLES